MKPQLNSIEGKRNLILILLVVFCIFLAIHLYLFHRYFHDYEVHNKTCKKYLELLEQYEKQHGTEEDIKGHDATAQAHNCDLIKPFAKKYKDSLNHTYVAALEPAGFQLPGGELLSMISASDTLIVALGKDPVGYGETRIILFPKEPGVLRRRTGYAFVHQTFPAIDSLNKINYDFLFDCQ